MSIKVILYFFSAVLVLVILLASLGGSLNPKEKYTELEENEERYEDVGMGGGMGSGMQNEERAQEQFIPYQEAQEQEQFFQ